MARLLRPYETRNLYSRLGIADTAQPDAIKLAFSRLFVEYYSMKGNTPENNMDVDAIKQAYRILSDSWLKGWYDRIRTKPRVIDIIPDEVHA